MWGSRKCIILQKSQCNKKKHRRNRSGTRFQHTYTICVTRKIDMTNEEIDYRWECAGYYISQIPLFILYTLQCYCVSDILNALLLLLCGPKNSR